MSEKTDAPPATPARRGPALDLGRLSAAELRAVLAEGEAMLRGKQEEAKVALRAKWQVEAQENGLTLDEVLAVRANSGAGRKPRKEAGDKEAGDKLPAKFRGPNGEAWSGRGRLPKWLQTAEAEGRKREDFRV